MRAGTDDACEGRSSGGSSFGRLGRLLAPASLVIVFGLLAAWSWRRWADPVIDFGTELYVPWRLHEGDLLYRDIAYRNGPLSPYLNALWFRLFGVSFSTLVYCNLAILAVICALSYRVFAVSLGRLAAWACGLTLLVAFGFAQYVDVGNYNYVAPYQHSQTHALALSIAMVAALASYVRTRAWPWCALAGALLGLVFLTKAELLVPALAAGLVGAGLAAASEPPGSGRPLSFLAIFTAGALLPPLLAFGLLRSEASSSLAWQGVLGNWRHLGGGLLGDPFYRGVAGLDDPAGNALLAARLALLTAGTLAATLIADRALARLRHRAPIAVVAGLAVFGVLAARPGFVPWFELARMLPLTSLAASVALAVQCARSLRDRSAFVRWYPLLLWSVLSLVLLGKMLLHARFHHYGFALAMPASLLLVGGLVGAAPALARRMGGSGALTGAVALALVLSGLLAMWTRADRYYGSKDQAIAHGGDAILARPARGRVVAEALSELRRALPADATLLVLPEGVILNYWLRSENPSRFHLFLPPEFEAHGGEEAMLEDLRAHPADYVVLVHRPHREFGVGPFGTDPRNGRRIMAWVRENYARVRRVGDEPFGDRGFGIVILRREPGREEAP